MNSISRVIYKLNEGNANNPADLLVGSEILVKRYDESGRIIGSMLGTLESITNEYVIVKDIHTTETNDFRFNGFNAHENAIEFVGLNDPQLKFYVY